MNKLRQRRQGGTDVFETGLRLSPAEVRKSPGGVSQHGKLRSVSQLLQQWAHRPLLKNEVAAHGGVARDVSQSPDLFPTEVFIQTVTIEKDYRRGLGMKSSTRLLCSLLSR